jgi:hypothetical protein
MQSSVTIKSDDNSSQVLAKIQNNKQKALTALGHAVVEVTLDYMTHKYYKDIHVTGELKRDVNPKVDPAKDEVKIGNSLEYAIDVHEGTRKMTKRPYLRDAILENTEIWQEVLSEHLKS